MNTGFTLIEVVIAMGVLAIVVSVALKSNITAINMEYAARVTQTVRFEIDRILAETLIDQLETNAPNAGKADCDIQASLVKIEKNLDPLHECIVSEQNPIEAGSTEIIQWEIVPKRQPGLKTSVFTHPRQQ